MFHCEVSMKYIQWSIFFIAMGIYRRGIYYVYGITFVILKYSKFDEPECLLQTFDTNKNCNVAAIQCK